LEIVDAIIPARTYEAIRCGIRSFTQLSHSPGLVPTIWGSGLWRSLRDVLSSDLELGRGHDADFALAQAAWCLTRHLRPERVIETGEPEESPAVSCWRRCNGGGHLWSIDLPPMREGWR
jgi:hypothetical protein